MSPEEFSGKTYDFLIVGGGTAGLTLAARLTEDANVSVGVIEAGQNRLDDPMIQAPGLFPQLMEKPEYDWAFKTKAQVRTLLVFQQQESFHANVNGLVSGTRQQSHHPLSPRTSPRRIERDKRADALSSFQAGLRQLARSGQ
jgi:choline dehydrogenase-like flavoprotein